jgi:multidrug efflux pump subunit AcrA (membrane-fusion protein)
MNYETQVAGDAPVRIFAEEPQPARRRALVIGAIVAIILIAIAGWVTMHGKGAEAPAAEQAPAVTVIVPGQSVVPRTISGTGSLAARVEMPVGVVGEGGEVRQVLVQPGDWVRAGQVLAVIERSVQAEQIRSLAAQLEVQRADAKLAQAQLDRAFAASRVAVRWSMSAWLMKPRFTNARARSS